MTVTEQARLAGIAAQLSVRGRLLSHPRSGGQFKALADHRPGFKTAPAGEGEYGFGTEERSQDSFYALRSDLTGIELAVGDEVTGDGSASFRVIAVEDTPNNLLVRFTVEVARA